VHYWRGKIFDRCIVRHRRAITCGLTLFLCNNLTPRGLWRRQATSISAWAISSMMTEEGYIIYIKRND
jgi:hypothetical protein